MKYNPKKPFIRPKIGIYSTGLAAYWDQFPSLKQRLTMYGEFISSKMAQWGDVYHFGMVDSSEEGKKAGEYFSSNQVDIIFVHAATYANSAQILPIHQRSNALVIILNLQPAIHVNYDETNTEEWLAQCGACPVPEFTNAFMRSNIKHHVISGLLGLEKTPDISLSDEVTAHLPESKKAWKTIEEWVSAMKVKKTLMNSRFGFLGNTYSGMLDLYSDFTMLQAQTGIDINLLEMCDLDMHLNQVSDLEIKDKEDEIKKMFIISEDSPSEKLAKKPTDTEINWAAKVAAAQERLIMDQELNALAYYYHGQENNQYEQLQSGFIVGHSLLTSQHVPCAGEGDLKTAIVMKMCDALEVGGSFCEIVTTDYKDNTILVGHDGPFHLTIAKGKPILRGMEIYHGKKGSGISVEAIVKNGPVTLVGLTQTVEGKLKLIISEGEATDGPTMKIGNTQTPVKFHLNPDEYYETWFKEGPTHHFAMSIGRNAKVFEKIGIAMNIETVII